MGSCETGFFEKGQVALKVEPETMTCFGNFSTLKGCQGLI